MNTPEPNIREELAHPQDLIDAYGEYTLATYTVRVMLATERISQAISSVPLELINPPYQWLDNLMAIEGRGVGWLDNAYDYVPDWLADASYQIADVIADMVRAEREHAPLQEQHT